MKKFFTALGSIAILFSICNLAYANNLTVNALLKGNYHFIGVYNCLNAPFGDFDDSGHPTNPQFSIASSVVISGVMSFDGVGTSTQNGYYTENTSPGAPSNTNLMPSVASGTFNVAASPYAVAKDGSVKVTTGVLSFTGSTGSGVGESATITNKSGQLFGNLSRNGSVVLSTREPLIQSVDLVIPGLTIPKFERRCSVTMTLLP